MLSWFVMKRARPSRAWTGHPREFERLVRVTRQPQKPNLYAAVESHPNVEKHDVRMGHPALDFPALYFAGTHLGFEDYSLAGAAVHYYSDRFGELQMADTALFFNRRLFG